MTGIGRSPSYLVRNPHSYCFRMMVPPDLKPLIGKKELRFSLKTGYLGLAKSKARALAGQFQSHFRHLRRVMNFDELTEGQIEKLSMMMVGAVSVFHEMVRINRDEPVSDEQVDRAIENLNDQLARAKSELRRGDYQRMSEFLDERAEAMGFGDILDERTYRILRHKLLIAEIKHLEFEIKRFNGDCTDGINDYFYVDAEPFTESLEAEEDTNSAISQPELQDEPEPEPSILLEELYEEFKAIKVKSGWWNDGTIRNHSPKIRALLQFVGNIPVNQITKAKMHDYRKLLDRLPPGFFSMKKYRDISALRPDELEGKHKKTMDVTTIREYMNLARSLFSFALDSEYLEKNPVVPGLIPPK